MPLNAYLAIGFCFALLLSPILLMVLLCLLPWLRRSIRRARAEGIVVLPAFLVDTVAAAAEAMIPDEPPAGGWRELGHHVDRYLASIRSPRRWRILAVLVLLEISPWLTLRRRLSRLAPGARAEFVRRRLATMRGPLAIPGLSRQLIRLAYYGDRSVARRLGFDEQPMRVAPRGARTGGRIAG